jgi:hypothetical protein
MISPMSELATKEITKRKTPSTQKSHTDEDRHVKRPKTSLGANESKKVPTKLESNSVKVLNSEPGKTSANASKESYETYFSKDPMLQASYKLVYEQFNVNCTSKPKSEAESKEYGAYEFTINNIKVKFRVAKSTPTKIGQFVTLWKRIGKGPIMPFDVSDPFDVYVVCVNEGSKSGQFVFPKQVLVAQGVLSKAGKGGKRAIRVYAPWVKTESSQASNTKMWQTKYFVNLSDSKGVDLAAARKLYGFN